nr:retrovirus-related Pol polyprotein from transposon TNT 1-94 [Tanacetum cinerariifolium]
MAVTLVNNNKKIRFTEHFHSSGNAPGKTTSSINVVSNKHVLSSSGVNLLTSASGSQPQGNTKKDRIWQTQSRAKKNNLEDHPRNVRPSLLNKKSVDKTKVISFVPNSKLNVNSYLKCATCNGCLYSDNHDSCVLKFINSVNAHVKSKSAKKPMLQSYDWRSLSAHQLHTEIFSTVKFRNDHVAKIMGYGDYKIGNVTILMVYFVEGPWHNLFFVGQFCDSDLEVAFRQHTCFICNLDGVDLLTGSRGNNHYTLSLKDMMASSPICLLYKASKTKSWLWHCRLSHLNFGTINHLARQGLVRGLPKLKFRKDHLCSACAMSKKSVNGKKYILVIVDDYSRFIWVQCLRSNDEAPYFIIKFLKMIQVRIKVPVRHIRTDNGTEFVNQTLREYYEQAVETACHTQNRSIIRLRHGKTPYELLHNKLHGLSFLHVFCAICYPTNDNENLGKLQPKADIGIFIGYALTKKAFWIYNRHTRRIVETIHVDFDELTAMASKQSSSRLIFV